MLSPITEINQHSPEMPTLRNPSNGAEFKEFLHSRRSERTRQERRRAFYPGQDRPHLGTGRLMHLNCPIQS